MKPWVLDLFCCAGGATRGYQQAGFRAYGVDKVPRPNYCGEEFRRRDALGLLTGWLKAAFPLKRYSLIHASPPCQARSTLTTGTNRAMGWGREHDQLVPAVRDLLDRTGLPYVIEQPSNHGGLIRTDLTLCGDMFEHPDRPPWVQRHRDFEIHGFTVAQPPHPKGPISGHRGYVRGYRGRHGGTPGFYRDGPYIAAYGDGGGKGEIPEMQHALGIDWTDVREELTEAIPPSYTALIGAAFLSHIGATV